MPGSVNKLRHIPTDEPLSLKTTQRENKANAPMHHDVNNAALVRQRNPSRGALCGFPKN